VNEVPSLTVKPAPNLSIVGALAFQWRETTADAVYVQPNVPVAGTTVTISGSN
jgi:Alginate export